MSIKTILFDLDGTLCNTLDDLADATNAVLTRHGLPARPVENFRQYVGNGSAKQLQRAIGTPLPQEQFEQIHREYLAYYGSHYLEKTKPYDGLPAVLQRFFEQGITMAVVTNKPQAMATNITKTLFGEWIQEVWGNNPQFPLKPDPEMTLHVMDRLGAKREETLFVGDSGVDMGTAQNCGIRGAGVTWGFRDKEELEAAGATHLVNTPQELLDLVLQN